MALRCSLSLNSREVEFDAQRPVGFLLQVKLAVGHTPGAIFCKEGHSSTCFRVLGPFHSQLGIEYRVPVGTFPRLKIVCPVELGVAVGPPGRSGFENGPSCVNPLVNSDPLLRNRVISG